MNIRNLKKNIINYLKDKQHFEEIDETLIQEYVANVHYARDARKEIKRDGITLTETRNGKGGVEYEIKRKHPAFDVYIFGSLHQKIDSELIYFPTTKNSRL